MWIKIKNWTKGIIFALGVIYAAIFVYNNSGSPVSFWWWFGHTPQTTVFYLAAFAFAAGVIFTLLVRMMWGTVRQFRKMGASNRTEKLEREMADMKAKAAMLQSKPTTSSDGVTVQVDQLGG